MKVEIYLVEII